MVNYIGHKRHGLATYINRKMTSLNAINFDGNEHSHGIRIGKLTIYNVYKPPSCNWTPSVLPVCQHPSIYVGELFSHSTEWGYTAENEDGELLSNWAAMNQFKLIYDAKQGGTFESGRWGTETSPDLCFDPKIKTADHLV